MTLREMQRYANEISKYKVKCSCSHAIYFLNFGIDIKICNHCGRKVYRNNRIEFKDLLNQRLRCSK